MTDDRNALDSAPGAPRSGWRRAMALVLVALLTGVLPPRARAEDGFDEATEPAQAVLLPFGIRGVRGGAAEHHLAVTAGLDWLAAHQSPDGGWEAKGWSAWCHGKPHTGTTPEAAGKTLYDVGVTGMALLAFLGAGYTPDMPPPYGPVLARGLDWLRGIQDAEGCFGPRRSQQYIYNHGFCAAAMVEAFGLTGDKDLGESAQAALDFVALARNPNSGWRYGIKPGDSDTSVTATMVEALWPAMLVAAAAERSGKPPVLRIDPEAIEGARAWVERVTESSSGRTGYVTRGTGPARPQDLIDEFPGENSESMTAAGIFIRIVAGEDPQQSVAIRKGAGLCLALLPSWRPKGGSIDLYYWYLATLALHGVGGDAWQRWRAAIDKTLLGSQRADGDACGWKGSWDPIGPWGPDGGRVYSTALALLMLEARWRYPPRPAPSGSDPMVAPEEIRAALDDSWLDAEIRGRLLRDLGRHRVPGALDELSARLQSAEEPIRRYAAQALGALGSEALSALPAMRDLLKDGYETVRLAAARCIGQWGPAAAAAAADLTALLEDRSAATRRAAARALGALLAPEAVEALRRHAADPDARVRVQVARALFFITKDASESRTILLDVLKVPDEDAQVAAVGALADLREGGSATLAALKLFLGFPSARLRLRGVEALAQLGGVEALRVAGGRLDPRVAAILFAALESQTPSDRLRACAVIRELGTLGEPWVKPLAKLLLEASSASVRAGAAAALGGLGHVAGRSAAALRMARHDPSQRVRTEAEAAWPRLGVASARAVPDLVEALRKGATAQRAHAALVELEAASVPALVQALLDKDDDFKKRVLGTLVRIGRPAVGPLVQALADPVKARARLAAWTLGRLAPTAQEIRPGLAHLVPLLGDKSEPLVAVVQDLLLEGGVDAAALLVRGLGDANAVVRRRSAETLARFLPAPPAALPALAGRLDDTDASVRRAAAKALAAFGEPSASAAGVLAARVEKDVDPAVRAAAAHALARIGPPAQTALPILVRAVRDKDDAVSSAALSAAGSVLPAAQPPAGLPPLAILVEDLGSAEAKVRRSAAVGLAALGPQALPAAEALARALVDTDPEVALIAGDALAWMGPDAVSVLLATLEDGPHRARLPAIRALGTLGSDAKPAVQALVDALKDRMLRADAVETLRSIGKPAVGPLKTALRNADPDTQAAVLGALGALGDEASSAVSTLAALSRSTTNAAVRAAALHALARIGKAAFGALRGALSSRSSRWIRTEAVRAMAGMTAHADKVSDLLERALRHEKDIRLKEAMAAAIERLRRSLIDVRTLDAENRALLLRGGALRLEPLPLTSFTVECWVRPEPSESAVTIVSDGSLGIGWAPGGLGRTGAWVRTSRGTWTLTGRVEDPRAWAHLALCFDGRTSLFFVNGKLQARRSSFSESRPSSGQPLVVGGEPTADKQAPLRISFRGAVDDLRVSAHARYAQDFEPRKYAVADDDTLLLLTFDLPDKEALHDLSGHDRHAGSSGAAAVESMRR